MDTKLIKHTLVPEFDIAGRSDKLCLNMIYRCSIPV